MNNMLSTSGFLSLIDIFDECIFHISWVANANNSCILGHRNLSRDSSTWTTHYTAVRNGLVCYARQWFRRIILFSLCTQKRSRLSSNAGHLQPASDTIIPKELWFPAWWSTSSQYTCNWVSFGWNVFKVRELKIKSKKLNINITEISLIKPFCSADLYRIKYIGLLYRLNAS